MADDNNRGYDEEENEGTSVEDNRINIKKNEENVKRINETKCKTSRYRIHNYSFTLLITDKLNYWFNDISRPLIDRSSLHHPNF